jgi:hypothetical protein
MPEEHRWDALSPTGARMLFDGFGAPWWVAGGWAIDLFLGRQTRPHGDIDLAILRADQPRLQDHLTGWDVHIAHDGVLTPWAVGDWLTPPRHQFWARPRPDAPWAFEILLEDHDGDEWVFRRDTLVRLPFDRFGRTSADGTPYVAPEIALLYKADAHFVPRNVADFDHTASALDAGAREWLHDTIAARDPHHPWLARLA